MNIGRMEISEKLFLDLFQFVGGRIYNITKSDRTGVWNVDIEHPDMPELNWGDFIPVVNPVYESYENDLGQQTLFLRTNK